MQMNRGCLQYKTVVSSFQYIFFSEGISGFYTGYKPCVFQDCSYAALQFLLYESLKEMGHSIGATEQAPVKTNLFCGAIAGGMAAWLTNPLDVVVNRIMLQQFHFESGNQHKYIWYNSTIDCLSKIWRSEGIRGLFLGSSARILSTMPLSAITFTVYERTKLFLSAGHQSSFDEFFT